jgi:hypothetical protein
VIGCHALFGQGLSDTVLTPWVNKIKESHDQRAVEVETMGNSGSNPKVRQKWLGDVFGVGHGFNFSVANIKVVIAKNKRLLKSFGE